MDITDDLVRQLIQNPHESLNYEIKRWLDPGLPDDRAKIVKALLALRNRGGGALIIGFDNSTLLPSIDNKPSNVRTIFHTDVIQDLVSRYASEVFEVAVNFGPRDGQEFPVISVPAGVRVVVALKADLLGADGTTVGRRGDVYVRSLHANGRVSTTKARPEDWHEILEICFNNREADIGAFFRRQLAGTTPQGLSDALIELLTIQRGGHGPTPCQQSHEVMSLGMVARENAIEDRRKKQPLDLGFTKFGTWNVALAICGDVPSRTADRDFLRLLASSNPNYTGWPVWLDSSNSSDLLNRPYVRDGGWESLIISEIPSFSNQIDFMRLEPIGHFFLSRVLPDDLIKEHKNIEPLTIFDSGLQAYRTAEAIAVGLAFARALGCTASSTILAFTFRWTALRGRRLGWWASPNLQSPTGPAAYDDDATVCVQVPLETAPSAIAPFVHHAIREVAAKFEGYVYRTEDVENLVGDLIARRP